MKFAYKRVSTIDQNIDRQLHEFAVDREYVDRVSGKDMNRPELKAMLSNIRDGDEIHVHELSRLGRSVKDLTSIVEQIMDAGGSIHFHKENLKFEGSKSDPFQSLMLNLLSSISQFERDLLLERQREGIAIAKSKGRYKGKQSRFTDDEVQTIRAEFAECANKTDLARKWGISRGYLYRLVDRVVETL